MLFSRYQNIDVNAAYSVAFQVLGYPWASKLVSVGAVAGIITSLLLNLLGQARIFMVLGRECFLPDWIVSRRMALKQYIVCTLMNDIPDNSISQECSIWMTFIICFLIIKSALRRSTGL